jgi:hypothetical protein
LERLVPQAGKFKGHYKKTARALEDLRETTGGDIDLEEVDVVRQMLRDIQAGKKPSERRMGAVLVERLDDYLDKLSAADVVAGNPMTATTILRDARSTWSRTKQGELIGELLERAELRAGQYSQSGMENAIRTEFRQLARNAKAMRTFTKAEQAAIRGVAEGEPIVNAMRYLGKLAPRGVVSASLGGGTGYLVGGPGGAAAVAGAGELGARAAGAMTQSRAHQAQDLMLRGYALPSGRAPAAGAFAVTTAGQQVASPDASPLAEQR